MFNNYSLFVLVCEMYDFMWQDPLRRIPRDSAVTLEHGRKPVWSFLIIIIEIFISFYPVLEHLALFVKEYTAL